MFNFEGIPSMTDRPYSPYLSDVQPQPDNIADQTALFLQNQRAITQRKLQEEDAVNQAIQAGLIPAIGDDGRPITFEKALQYSLRSIANNADSSFESRAEEALRNNPVVTLAYPDEASFKGIRDDVVKRSRLLNNNHNVNSVLRYGDTPFTKQVEGWNTEDPGFLNRLYHGTLEALGYNGRGDIEHDIARLDERLSAYPKEFRNAFKKMEALHREDLILKSLREQATHAQTEEEYQNLHAKIEAQTDKVHDLEKLLTDEDKQILQVYGKEYLQDQKERNALKNVEQEMTPRYSTTWNKDMEIAKLKQEYAARGEDPSFTNPRSFYNGYARKWLGTHLLDWNTLTKEVGAEVLPWVLINGSVDIGAALLTRGMSIPGSVARWMTRFGIQAGMAVNSAHNAIDKNLDMYYQKYGTVEGFSRAQSDFMEATAFFLDMYGSRLIASGLPHSIAASMDAYKLSVKEAIGNIFKASRQAYAATGSLATVNAGFKTAYNLANGTAFLEFIGGLLEKAGEKSVLTYGGLGGKATQLAGMAITGGTKVARSEFINPALGLATENMMSETARQHARQAGFNTEAIAEAGMKGIAAGPLGHWGGYVMSGAAAGGRMASRKLGGTFRYAYTDNEMKDTKDHVQDVINNGSDKTKAKTYEDLTKKIEELEDRATSDRKATVMRDKVQSILNKYKGHLDFGDVDATTSELPDPDAVDRDNPTNRWEVFKQREVKSAKSRYRKDYNELKREEGIMSEADERINTQITQLKKMQEKLGESITDESSIYEMSEKTQKAYLKTKGHSEEEATSIIEDTKGTLKIQGVSKTALNKVRNIFGSHAPGKLNEALKNMSESGRKAVVDELNNVRPNYANIEKKLSTIPALPNNATAEQRNAYNKATYANEAIRSIFKNAAEKQKAYREGLKNKELDITKLTADEAEALDPKVFDGLNDNEINTVLQLMQANPALQKNADNGKSNSATSAQKAVQEMLRKAGRTHGDKVTDALQRLSEAWMNHQLHAGVKERGDGIIPRLGVQGERSKEGVFSEDIHGTVDLSVAAGRTSDIEPVSDYLKNKHSLGEIQTFIKNLSKSAQDTTADSVKGGVEEKIINFLKNRIDFRKAVKTKNKLTNGELKNLLKSFNSVDDLVSKLNLSESQAVDLITTSIRFQHIRETQENKKASEKTGKSLFKHIAHKRMKAGYESVTELRDKAIKAREEEANKTHAQKRNEELAEAYRKDDAAFLFDGTWTKPQILKFMMYIHDKKFGGLISGILDGTIKDDPSSGNGILKSMYNWMLNNSNNAYRIEGNKVILSDKWMNQLSHLIIACRYFAKQPDSTSFEYMGNNLNALYCLIQKAASNEHPDIHIEIKNNTKESNPLWQSNYKIFHTEILTTDKAKEELYNKYSGDTLPNATTKIITFLQALNVSPELYEQSYQEMLDMDSINNAKGVSSKALLGFTQLVGGALQQKLIGYLGASQVTLGEQYFGLINFAADGDALWNAINSWGFRNPKEGYPEGKNIRQELHDSSIDPAVRLFFSLDGSEREGDTRTIETWKKRWNALSIHTQRAVALKLLQNKYILGTILKLPRITKSNDPKHFTDNASGMVYEKITSQDELTKILNDVEVKTLGAKSQSKTTLYTKMALARLLADMGLVDELLVQKYNLESIINPKNKEAIIRLFTKGIFKDKNYDWKNVIDFVRIFRQSATFVKLVDGVIANPLGERGHLPDNATIDTILDECSQAAGDTALFDQVKKLNYIKSTFADKAGEFKDEVKAVFGNILSAAGFLSLCHIQENGVDVAVNDVQDVNNVNVDTLRVPLETDVKILTQLDNAISYMQEAAASYTDFAAIDESHISAEQLDGFIKNIINSKRSIRGELPEDVKQNILNAPEFDNNALTRALDGFLQSIADGKYPDNLDQFDANSRLAVAKAFATFINKYQISNTVVAKDGSIITDYLDSMRHSDDSLAAKAHKYSELWPSNNIHKLFINPKNAVFLHERGFDRFLAENPLLANNEFIRLIKNVSEQMANNVRQMANDVIGETEFDLEGNIYQHTLQTAVAVGLAMMPRLSVNANPDFIEAIRGKYGARAASTFADQNNNLVDMSATARAMGFQIARILGYNKYSPQFNLIATRLGGIACLSLCSSGLGVKAVWVTPDGSIKGSESSGLDKSGAIPALQLTDKAQANKQRIETALKTKGSDGSSRDLAEVMLGTELFSNEQLYTDRQQQTDLNAFFNEYIDYNIDTIGDIKQALDRFKQIRGKDDNDQVITHPNDRVLDWQEFKSQFMTLEITPIISEFNNKECGRMVKVGDVALVMYQLTGDGQIKDWDDTAKNVQYTVLKGRSITKTDLTSVSPYRLLTNVINQRKGVTLHRKDALHFFAPLLEMRGDEWQLKEIFTRVDDLTPDQVEELCRKDYTVTDKDGNQKTIKRLTDLGILLYENSRFGSNPNGRSGVPRLNMRISNKEDLKKLVKDCEALLKIKAIADDDQTTTLYFNELNTVNNRLFVDSLRFNYREFKHYRSITSVQNIDVDVSQIDETQTALLVAPIMANLGLDIDKMRNTDLINQAWSALLNDDKFHELLVKLTGLDANRLSFTNDVIKLLYDYNAQTQAQYKVYKSNSGKETDAEPIQFKVNVESVTALSKLKQISDGELLQSILKSHKQDMNTFMDNIRSLDTISGYNILIEVDGLTNGPSIKNIISNLPANKDVFSALYMGATGISRDFNNIIEGYADYGVLDTYLYNGKLSKEDLVYQAYMEMQNNNDKHYYRASAYISSLYGETHEIGKFTLPASFLDTFVSALNKALNRDFLKPQVMVIGYEAGRASVIATNMTELDTQFSKNLSSGDAKVLEAWCDNVHSTYGESVKTIVFDYTDGTRVTKATLNVASKVITCDAFRGPVKISALTKEQVKNISINHMANVALAEVITDTFSSMYDSIANNKQVIQSPFRALTESSQVLCDVFDTMLRKALEHYATNSDDNGSYYTSADFAPKLAKIVEDLTKGFNTIARGGVEKNEANKAAIQLSKQDVETLVGEAIAQYTVTKDGKYYLRVKTGFAARVSLGAGVVPMSIHTLDSSIVNVMMGKVLQAVNQRVLTIHDAGMFGLFQQLPGKDRANGIKEMNKAHYECANAFYDTLVNYTANLYQAINGVSALSDTDMFKLSADEVMVLTGKLSAAADKMFTETAQLVALREKFYNDELRLPETKRVSDFQYSFVGSGNKSDAKAIGGFTPTDSQLIEYIQGIRTIQDKLINLVDLHSYKNEVADAVRAWAKDTGVQSNELKAVFDSKGNFYSDVWKHATNVTELSEAIAKRVLKGSGEEGRIAAKIRTAIDAIYQDSPEFKLKKAIIQSYRDMNNENIATYDKSQAYAPKAQTDKTLTSIEAADTAEGLIRTVYQLSENAQKNAFFHINDAAALQRIRVESAYDLGGFNSNNGILSVFSLLRTMTGLNRLTESDRTSFTTIFNILAQYALGDKQSLNIPLDDKIKDGKKDDVRVVFTDSNDYTQILRKAKASQMLTHTDKFEDSYLINWFGNIMNNMKKYENRNVQLIFTLRSEGDLLHLLALQALKNLSSTADAYKNVSVYIAPGISNLTSESPAVDKEVALLQVLKAQHENIKADYVTSTHYTHNVTLQSYVMGREISQATAERGIRIGDEYILGLQEITVNTDAKGRLGSYYKYYSNIKLDPETFGNGGRSIIRTDELGRVIQSKQNAPVEGLDEDSGIPQQPVYTDLLTAPRDTELTYNYDTNILTPTHPFESVGIDDGVITPLNVDQHSGNSIQNFEEILGRDSSVAPIIETSAEGHIAHPTLRDYSQHSPELQEAVIKANAVRQERLRRYQTSTRTERDWNEYLLPIVVSVPVDGFADKYFIFVTSFDNSITQGDLMDSILDRGTGELAVAQMSRIREGSNLAGMLKESAKTNYRFMRMMSKKKEEEAGIKITSHVIIPEDYITPSLKIDTGKLSEHIMYRNAYCLNSIRKMLNERGVTQFTLPVQSLREYRYQATEQGYSGPRFANEMHDSVRMYQMEMPTDVFDSLVQSIAQRKQREKMVFASLQTASIKRYRGYAPSNELDPSHLTEEWARRSTEDTYLVSANSASTVLTYDKAEQQFNELLDHLIEDDESRGVDTELIQENRSLFSGLITLSNVVMFNDPAGIEASYTGVSSLDKPLERNEVFLGRALGTQSWAEAFMHEMFHTVLTHLGRNNPAIKKKLTDLYSFVIKNLTYADFTDGQTYTNESIMDAITNEQTPDNVEEFMCYYLTNKAFHTAVENMAKRKGANISNVLKTNSIGIFRRILATIKSWFMGKKSEYQEVKTIKEIVTQAVSSSISYNNQFWQNRRMLLENATNSDIQKLSKAETRLPAGAKQVSLQALSDQVVNTAVSDNKFDAAVKDALNKVQEVNFFKVIKQDWNKARDGFLNDLMASLEGVSKRQFDYLILRTRGKAQIDQKREQIKSAINQHVREILKDVPEKYYEQLTAKFVRTDASCLFRNTDKNLNQIKELITEPAARSKEIKRLEAVFQNYDYRNYIINSAKGLAQYLVTGFNPTGIGYRNAHEILARAGSSSQTVTVAGPEFNALNQLITLYALDLIPGKEIEFMSSISAETLNKLAEVHNGIKDADNDSVYPNALSASTHVPKGELHTTNNTHRYEIIPEEELKAYEWTGYRKVSNAVLDPFFASEYPNTRFVMVRAPFKSDAATTAGIFSMTNVFKGRSAKGIRIGDAFRTNKDEIPFRHTAEYARIKAYMDKRIYELNTNKPNLLTTPTSGNMVLNFNSMNTLCGATFEVNPIESIKQRSTSQKITSIFGNLYGSVLERTESPLVNTKIGEAMIDIYENSKEKQNFVWIKPNSLDADYRELYENLPYEIKDLMREKYQDMGVPVHSRALNTVFGYKNLSANDTKKFIANERAKKENANQLARNFSVDIGNILYNGYLGNIESLLKWLAKTGKENIVIKGVTTSWYNIVSNCVLLHMKGLSAKQVVNYQLEALKQYDTIRQLSYQLAVLKRKQILNQYTDADAKSEAAIRHTIESLDIYPLYKEGITGNTIAEDLTESDGFVKKIIHAAIPRGTTRTVVSNLALSNESMLYKILADFASLGDITGKYALYKYNKEKFADEKEALRQSLETFIDYSNPLPKQLQLMDDLAVLPFMKYALGIQRVIGQLMTQHPSRSIGWILGANTLVSIPNTFQSLLDFDSVADRMQLPGEMFTDSFAVLPSWKALSQHIPDD